MQCKLNRAGKVLKSDFIAKKWTNRIVDDQALQPGWILSDRVFFLGGILNSSTLWADSNPILGDIQ